MKLLTAIEKAHYLASPNEVERLASERLTAHTNATKSDTAYFRILLAATQKAVAGRPTLRARRTGPHSPRNGKTPKTVTDQTNAAEMSNPQVPGALDKFEEVNALYYAAVVKGSMTPELEDQPNLSAETRHERALQRNRRTNYARTAASSIRSFIRAGGDLTSLVVTKTTKAHLRAYATAGSPTDPLVRLERAGARLTDLLSSIHDKDKAREALQPVVAKILALSRRATKDPTVAMTEHRPLQTTAGLFFPTLQ